MPYTLGEQLEVCMKDEHYSRGGGLGRAAAPHPMERHCTFSPKGLFRQALRGQSGGVGWMELSSET